MPCTCHSHQWLLLLHGPGQCTPGRRAGGALLCGAVDALLRLLVQNENRGAAIRGGWARWKGSLTTTAYPDTRHDVQAETGCAASMVRCGAMLTQFGVEGVKLDRHEDIYCLEPDHVAGICYLQNGYYNPEGTGLPPDFYFVDTMWDKLK